MSYSPGVGMEVPAPPGSSPSCGCFWRSCATTVGSEALSTPSEASCVAALLNAPLPMSSRSLVVSPAVPRPSACVCAWVSRCARLCELRAALSLSTRRLCMSPTCSPFSHCCSLAATRPAPPCWEALRRPRFPPLIAGLRKSWGAKINHMRALRTRIPLSDAFPRLRALHWVIASLNSSSMCPIVRTYALPPSLPPGGWTYVGAWASDHFSMSTLSTASQ